VSIIFIQVVSQDILEKIVELEKPDLTWTLFRTEYYSDSADALVNEIINLVSLLTQYSGNNLSDLISKFEFPWLHLGQLSNGSSDSHRKTSAAFPDEDQGK